MNARHHYGNDGSDQMAQVTFTVSLLAKAFPNDSRAREACLRFVAFQACVSYASSRHGQAGLADVAKWFCSHRNLPHPVLR